MIPPFLNSSAPKRNPHLQEFMLDIYPEWQTVRCQMKDWSLLKTISKTKRPNNCCTICWSVRYRFSFTTGEWRIIIMVHITWCQIYKWDNLVPANKFFRKDDSSTRWRRLVWCWRFFAVCRVGQINFVSGIQLIHYWWTYGLTRIKTKLQFFFISIFEMVEWIFQIIA